MCESSGYLLSPRRRNDLFICKPLVTYTVSFSSPFCLNLPPSFSMSSTYFGIESSVSPSMVAAEPRFSISLRLVHSWIKYSKFGRGCKPKNQVKNLQYISRHSGDSYQPRLETLALLENPVGLREQFFRTSHCIRKTASQYASSASFLSRRRPRRCSLRGRT